MDETIPLGTLLGLTGTILFAFLYGSACSFLFWRQDRLGGSAVTWKRIAWFVGIPVMLGIFPFFGPNAAILGPRLGWFFQVYASLGIGFLTYFVPASIAGVVVLIRRKDQKRWFYSLSIFGIASSVMLYRILSIFWAARENSH
jgi:hypothetical protein